MSRVRTNSAGESYDLDCGCRWCVDRAKADGLAYAAEGQRLEASGRGSSTIGVMMAIGCGLSLVLAFALGALFAFGILWAMGTLGL